MEFSVIYSCLGKGKVFSDNSNLTNLVDIPCQYENGKWSICASHGLYTLFRKTFLLFHTALIKCFICSRVVGILNSTWCNNSCRVDQELGQGDFYNSIRKKFTSFQFIYYLFAKNKSNHKKNHAYLNLIFSICHRFHICRLVKLLFLSLFPVSSPPSTTTWRLPHSSSMNSSLGKSTRFPIPSIRRTKIADLVEECLNQHVLNRL